MGGVSVQSVSLDERKARGAFFTPSEITRFLTRWAIRTSSDRVLEPCCGEAAFLLTASERFRTLGAPQHLGDRLYGFDIHPQSVAEAKHQLSLRGFDAKICVADFFQQKPEPSFDAVIGNPPYVRYQSFSGTPRLRALEAALRQGVRLNQLASSWAAFTIHASAFLNATGRLGLVLPAELIAVKYASQVRHFLLERFAQVRLVLFENLVFPGVLEEVVLLLAEGTGRARQFEVLQARDVTDLEAIHSTAWVGFRPKGGEKWVGALLPPQTLTLYERLLDEHGFEVMLDWGDTYLGAVTGNNNYFTLTRHQVENLKLQEPEILRISPPGSRHLRGLELSSQAWEALAEAGERCYLFAPGNDPSRAALKYIEDGEKRKIHHAYKCKVRLQWWKVPLVARPDFLYTYMNYDRPRLIRNDAEAHVLNSLYGVQLHRPRRNLGQELLSLASLNSMTLLGAEIVGRSYGGGILKHEPTEADQLPLPSHKVLEEAAPQLRLLLPQVTVMLQGNEIGSVRDIVDRIILKNHLELSDDQIKALREARETLLQRRMRRAHNGKN